MSTSFVGEYFIIGSVFFNVFAQWAGLEGGGRGGGKILFENRSVQWGRRISMIF